MRSILPGGGDHGYGTLKVCTSNRLPRLVIAAPQGRSGKTTVSLGLCAALAGRGLTVQPFKKGPDYIDPSWLSAAAGRPCRSLDAFFLPEAQALRRAFFNGAQGASLNLVEGNHGLYDSAVHATAQEDDGRGSTAAAARVLQAPVILVMNAARMTRSAAAIVRGCQVFEPETPIRGVILNHVAQSRHEARLRLAIEHHCGIPVIGALPRDEQLAIPDRHLGLTPLSEAAPSAADGHFHPALMACRQAAERYINLEAVLEIARSAPAWDEVEAMAPVDAQIGYSTLQEYSTNDRLPDAWGTTDRAAAAGGVIGVVRDRVFSFYYPENLEALQEAGARLVYIDALRDARLPEIGALYIGGGFPEMFMEELAANESLRWDVRQAVQAGLPVYAECGGLMYLARSLRWIDGLHSGAVAPMAGALPCDVEMTGHPQGHGYVMAHCDTPNSFFKPGALLRGHEFHNSHLAGLSSDFPTAFRLERGKGVGAGRDGLVYRNTLAGYTHLHAYGAPGWAAGLVARASGSAG